MRKIYGGLIFFFMYHLVVAQTTFVLGGGTGACHPSCSTQGACITGGSFESLIITLNTNESITISSTAYCTASPKTSGRGFDTGENLALLKGSTSYQFFTGLNNAEPSSGPICYYNNGNTTLNLTIAIINNTGTPTSTDRADETVSITYTISSGNSGCTLLPIQLSSFEITPSKTPIITWTTLSESDNSHFILERSRNGEDFIQINTIQGKGTIDAKNEYAYTDLTPLKGTNYYRLKQVDYDGTMTSFGIKSTFVPVEQIEVYPTLMQDLINIDMPLTDRPTRWFISNSLGQRSLKGILAPGVVKDALNVQPLAPGTYFLSLQTQYGQVVFKLIKL